MFKIYYHNDLRISDNICQQTFESFRNKYEETSGLLTNHYQLRFEKHYQIESDSSSERWQGRLIEPRIINFLKATGETCEQIDTVVPDKDGVLVIYWPSIANMAKDVLDQIFGKYTGHVLIDDTYETHLTRCAVTKEWLEQLGYDLSNVTFWTNGPNKNNVIDFESKLIRQNWLHLVHLYETRKPIPEIKETDELKYFKNKLKRFLYMNGHSTAQREYVAGQVTKQNDLGDFMYSFINPNDNYKDYFLMGNKDRESFINRYLPDDVVGGATAKDNFVNKEWWTYTYYYVNIETNFHWRDHNARMLTEKWMKPIMYLTPSFNIGDYPGLEEYTRLLGFEDYSQWLDKGYDNTDNWYERGKQFAQSISETERPSEADWNQMMEAAEYNYHHFYNNYIPNLTKIFKNSLSKILDKS